MFEQVEPQFREETILRYVTHAKFAHASWVERMLGSEPCYEGDENNHYAKSRFKEEVRGFMAVPQYTMCDPSVDRSRDYRVTWEEIAARVKAGNYAVNEKEATRDANHSVDQAKRHFIEKQTKKIENASARRTDFRYMEGQLRCEHVVTGFLTVYFKNGDRFSIHMNMIVNHRYERGYTSFYQYPARFYDVVKGGNPVKKVSEKLLQETF